MLLALGIRAVVVLVQYSAVPLMVELVRYNCHCRCTAVISRCSFNTKPKLQESPKPRDLPSREPRSSADHCIKDKRGFREICDNNLPWLKKAATVTTTPLQNL